MKRTIISAAVLALGLAGAGVSLADPGDGGPSFNGNNQYGLCTAWTNHQDEHGNDNPQPFQDLQPPDGYDSVEEYCAEVLGVDGPGNSNGSHTNNGGGKPDNG